MDTPRLETEKTDAVEVGLRKTSRCKRCSVAGECEMLYIPIRNVTQNLLGTHNIHSIRWSRKAAELKLVGIHCPPFLIPGIW